MRASNLLSFIKPELWFLIYALMLLIPSLIISGDGFAKALYPLLFFIAVICHYRYFFWLSLPFYILSPLVIYYEIIYDTPTDITLWFTLLGSSQSEAQAYLSSVNLVLAIGLIAVYSLLLLLFIRKIPKAKIPMPFWLRVLLLCLIFVPMMRYFKTEGDHLQRYLNVYRHYKQSYPLNLMMGYPAANMEVQRVKQFVASQDQIQCHRTAQSPKTPQTIVMVIGESARRDRLGLYGYKTNPTTPFLAQKRDELWVFDNMISGSFITSRSVPALLTGRVEDTDQLFPSFLNAFNSAGFQTYWLSAQAKFGEYDSLVSAYAHAAKTRKFLNQHSYSASLHDFYDGELMPDFKAALAQDPEQDKLIVLHFYGSHADFKKRYPAEFGVFSDPYDNSIRYTDYLLDQVIETLKQHGGLSSMLYVSDHGLNLGQCLDNDSTHMDMKSNYEVPFVMWASADWKKQYPEQSQRLSQAQQQPLSAQNIMPSILDLGHIRCPTIQSSSQRSIFEGHLIQPPRKVLTLVSSVDYDQSQDDDQCHLIQQAASN